MIIPTLFKIGVIDSIDEYYAKLKKEQEEIDEELRLNPDFDYGESYLIKKHRLGTE